MVVASWRRLDTAWIFSLVFLFSLFFSLFFSFCCLLEAYQDIKPKREEWRTATWCAILVPHGLVPGPQVSVPGVKDEAI